MIRTLLIDPLTIKELSGISRRWQTFVGRGIFVGLLAAVVLMFWAQALLVRTNPNPSQLAAIGREMFGVYFGVQILLAALFSTSAACDLVLKEVRAGTLGLLSLTPLSSWRIAAGKWKAALAQAGTLVLAGMPILAVCVYTGGIGVMELVWSSTVTVGAILLCTSISLFYSSVFRSAAGVILITLLTLFLYIVLPAFLLFWGFGRHGEDLFILLSHVHVAYASVVSAVGMMGHVLPGTEYSWATATAVMAFFLLLATSARITALARRTPSKPVLERAFEKVDRFMENVSPRPLRRFRLFPGSDRVWESRAMLWKELRTRASGKLRNATRIGLLLLLIVVLPLSLLFAGGFGWQIPMLWISGIVLLILAMGSGVSLFVKEKEERKWDVLLSTPLTAGEIVGAKLLGGLTSLAPLSAILLFLFSLVAWATELGPLGYLVTLGTIGLFVLFAYLLAAVASLHARTLRGAFSFTGVLVVGILFVLPFLMSLYDAMTRTWWEEDEFPYVLVTITNPATFLAPFGSYFYSWQSDAYTPLLGYFVFYVLIYGALSAGLLLYLKGRFDRVTGRSPNTDVLINQRR